MLRYLVLLLVLGMAFGTVHAGPFGLKMGMTKAEIESAIGAKLEEVESGVYYTKKVPIPYPLFSYYNLTIHSTHGLHGVRAYSNETDSLKTAMHYDDIKRELIALYGAPTFDYDSSSLEMQALLSFTIWTTAEFLTARGGEQSPFLGKPKTSVLHKRKLEAVGICVRKDTQDIMEILYTFENHNDAMSEKAKSSGL